MADPPTVRQFLADQLAEAEAKVLHLEESLDDLRAERDKIAAALRAYDGSNPGEDSEVSVLDRVRSLLPADGTVIDSPELKRRAEAVGLVDTKGLFAAMSTLKRRGVVRKPGRGSYALRLSDDASAEPRTNGTRRQAPRGLPGGAKLSGLDEVEGHEQKGGSVASPPSDP